MKELKILQIDNNLNTESYENFLKYFNDIKLHSYENAWKNADV